MSLSKSAIDRELAWEVRKGLPRERFAPSAHTSGFDGWLDQVLWAFRALAASPARLFAVMFAINALSNPYSGLVHDAVVYSLQALNAASQGAYQNDLFLKYGSQDRFSLFSPLVGPIVRMIGVRPAFFILFLASTSFWLWAASRLMYELFDDTAVAAAASIFAAVAPMWYGGVDIFQVAEPFFTPRLPACALAMLGIAWVLRDKIWRALALLGGAAMLHPIMALPALVVWGGYVLLNRLTRTQALPVCVAGAAAALFVLANGSLAGHAFPQMDDTWRNIVHRSPLNFPLDWTAADWLGIAAGASIVSAASWLLRDRDRAAAQVLALVALAGIGGVAVAVFASQSPNALLFQAQAYRALWLVSFLEGPVAVWLLLEICRSQSPIGSVFGSALILYLGRRRPFETELVLAVAIFLVMLIVRCVRTHARLVDIALGSLAWSAVIAAAVSPIVPPLAVSFVNSELLRQQDPVSVTEAILGTLAPVCLFALVGAVLVLLHRRGQFRRVVPAGLTAFALAVHSTAFALPLSQWYKTHFQEHAADLLFTENYLASHSDQRPLSVYADFAPSTSIWIDWHETSYFQTTQSVGVIFSRANALEVRRRIGLVRPFEVPRWRKLADRVPYSTKLVVDHMYHLEDVSPPPTTWDLVRLCAEKELDLVIVSGPPLAKFTATNGHVYVYDCRLLRSAAVVKKGSDVE